MHHGRGFTSAKLQKSPLEDTTNLCVGVGVAAEQSAMASTNSGNSHGHSYNSSVGNKSQLSEELVNFKRSLEPHNSANYASGRDAENRTVRVDNDVLAFMSIASKLDPIPSLAIKCRRLMKGHNGKVLCLDWSQDKRHLVSSSQDGKIMVWDAFPSNCKQEHCISVPTTWLMACSFAPSGQFVAAGGLDNKITAYPLYGGDYNDMDSSSHLLGGSASSHQLSALGGGQSGQMSGSGAASPSAGSQTSGGGNSSSGFTPSSNQHQMPGGNHQSQQTSQSQQQQQQHHHQQQQQQQQGGQQQANQQAQQQQQSAAYSKRRPIGTHTSYTSCSQFLNNDQQILTGSGDSTCALWSVECGTLIQSFYGHSGDVLSLDVSPGEMGNTFVSVGCDKRALIWDTRIGHCGQNQYIQSFKAHKADINSVKYYPSGDSILTGSDDTTCRLYDLRADQEVAVYEKNSILFGINSIDLSISGRILFAAGNDYTIHVWDTLRRNRICVLYGHESRVTCVRVSADGTALASGSWDHTIRVWA